MNLRNAAPFVLLSHCIKHMVPILRLKMAAPVPATTTALHTIAKEWRRTLPFSLQTILGTFASYHSLCGCRDFCQHLLWLDCMFGSTVWTASRVGFASENDWIISCGTSIDVERLGFVLLKAVESKCQMTTAIISEPCGSQRRQRRRRGICIRFGWAWCCALVVLVLGRQTGESGF